MLAKHETPIKLKSTIFGRVPAKLSTLVTRTRSMFVLLIADAIVKPPISSIIVGENICLKMYLKKIKGQTEMNKASIGAVTLWHGEGQVVQGFHPLKIRLTRRLAGRREAKEPA